MGESREGEGRTAGPTTSQIARSIVQEYEDDEGTPDQIRVVPVAPGVFAVEVLFHGVAEPERRLVAVNG